MSQVKNKTIAIIGVGLIGGSMAISLKERGFASHIIGVEKNEGNLTKALGLGLIDEQTNLNDAIEKADIIIVAVPMNAFRTLLPAILDKVTKDQVVLDVGSTKEAFLRDIKEHPNRGRFVATHPMAGTEYSGPEAALDKLFDEKCTVFCDAEDSDTDAVELVKNLYECLNMGIINMGSEAHDMHVAYVSHISHISSFALALTVLEKEKEEKRIFELASGGFESTVRLAKSSPDTWASIFMQNRYNVLDVLYEMIFQLKKMKQLLIDDDEKGFYKLIEDANKIKKIIQ